MMRSQQLSREVPIPLDYIKNFDKRWEMARKAILPPSFESILKIRYPLPLQQQPPTVSSPSGIRIVGNEQIESDPLEAFKDGQKEERRDLLAARPDDKAGNKRTGEEKISSTGHD